MLKKLYANPATVICISILVTVFGLFRFYGLPIALYPDTARPILEVIIHPTTIEAEDFKKQYGSTIEAKLLGLSKVEDVEGFYRNGRVHWSVTFAWDTPEEKAESDVKAALNSIESKFPKEWDSFSYHFQKNNNAGIYLSVSSKLYSNDELWELLEDRLRIRLERIEDIDHVFINKPFEEYVEVSLNYHKLLSLGLSAKEVKSSLLRTQYNHALPRLKSSGGARFPLTIPLKETSLAELRQSIIGQNGDKVLRLTDIASVKIANKPPREMIKGNGKKSLILGASIKSSGNIANACNDFEQIAKDELSSLDKNMEVNVLVNPSQFIQESIENIAYSVLCGISIATLIIFLFLGSFRLTMIIGVSIPLSLIGGFIIMSLSGIELNLISLGAMALAVGMVVDGSIVVLENIDRHVQLEKPKTYIEHLEVVYHSVLELRSAVISSLLTTIIVFAPLSFTAPLANAILGDLAKVMVCVLTISIVVTLLLVPSLMMILSKSNSKKNDGIYFISTLFQKLITKCEKYYLATLSFLFQSKKRCICFFVIIALLLVSSYTILTTSVKREILATPDTDKVWLVAKFQKEEFELDEVDTLIQPYENILLNDYPKEIHHFLTFVVKDGAHILCNLKDKKMVNDFKEKLEKRFVNTPRLHFFVSPWNPTSLKIPNPPLLRVRIAGENDEIKREMQETIISIVQSNNNIGKIESFPRSFKSNDFDVKFKENIFLNSYDNALSIQNDIESLLFYALRPQKIKELSIKGRRDFLDVNISTEGHTLEGPEDINNLLINYNDEIVPLRHFLDVVENKRWGEWYTERGKDTFKIELDIKSKANSIKEKIEEELRLSILKNPEIVQSNISFDDTKYEINNNIYSLVYALLFALALIWIVVSLQFGSLWQTALIMSAIPLGFIGVSFSLYLLNSNLSVNSMLGLILLCGTAVNNSILFVDFFNNLKASSPNFSEKDIILKTAKLRFRPILITTATTILGMFPIALGFGSGGEILQPLGIAVCGGLGLSTFLTLIMVPLLLFIKNGEKNSLKINHKAHVIIFFFSLQALSLLVSDKMSAKNINQNLLALKQAEQLAWKNSYKNDYNQSSSEILKFNERGYYASYLPEITLHHSMKSTSGQDSIIRNSEIVLSEKIPNPYAFMKQNQIFSLEEKQLSVESKKSKIELVSKVRKQFIKILKLTSMQSLIKENIILLAKINDENSKRYDNGFIHKADLLKSRLYFENVVSKQVDLNSKISIEKENFNILLGHQKTYILDLSGSLAYKDQNRIVSWSLKDLKKKINLSKNLNISLEKLQYEKNILLAQESKSNLFPDFSLSSHIPISKNENSREISYSLSATWSVFSGGRSYSDYKKKVEQSKLSLAKMGTSARAENMQQNQLLLSLESSKNSLLSQVRILDSWKEIVSISQKRFKLGHMSYKDFSDDLLNYLGQKEKQIELVFESLMLWIDLSERLDNLDLFYEYYVE